MRRVNSVGGYRIYPTSPQSADVAAYAESVLGQFNDGMDRLHYHRELSPAEQQILSHARNGSTIAVRYQVLLHRTSRLWNLALAQQDLINHSIPIEINNAAELAASLIACSEEWEQLKVLINQS